MLQMSSMLFQALKVVFDKPQGQARGYTNTFYQLICGGVSYAGTTPIREAVPKRSLKMIF